MIYILLFIVIAVVGKTGSNTQLVMRNTTNKRWNITRHGWNLFFLVSLLSFSILAGFRGENVGVDTRSYTYLYNLFLDGASVQQARNAAMTIEYGYLALCKVLVFICRNRVFFFFCNGLIIYVCYLAYQKKYSSNFPLSVLMFTALYYTSTFNIVRQHIAIGCVLMVLILIDKRKYLVSILLFIVSILIHQSSLMLLPVIILFLIPNLKKAFFAIEVLVVASLMLLQVPYIMSNILRLLNYRRLLNGVHFTVSDSRGLMAYIYLLIIALGFLTLYRAKDPIDEKFYFYLICTSIGTGFAFMANKNEMFSRAGAGYLFFSTLLLPNIIDKLFEKNKNRTIVEGVTILLLFIAMVVSSRGYKYSLYTG